MELRMLLGLHSGAALELGDETLALGSSPEADVMVADPGVASIHLRIARRGERFVLEPAEGKVFDEREQEVGGEIELAPGCRFRVGDAWIGFFDVNDPWEKWTPPLPVAELSPSAAAPVPEMADAPAMAETEAEVAAGTETEAMPAAEAEAQEPDMPMSRVNAAFMTLGRQWAALTPGKRRLAATAGIVLLIVLIALGAAANMMFDQGAARRKPAKGGGAPVPVKERAADGGAGLPAPSSQQQMTSEALAEIFQRELAERDLLERVDLDLRKERWEIRASLDADEEGRLHRLLKRVDKLYHPGFPIKVTLVPLKDLLPFKVIEVTSGKGANIVTDKGSRLFVGDSLDGYRLAEIGQGKIVFTGKRRIEVAW